MCTRCKFGGRQGCDSSLRRCPGLWVCGLNAVLLLSTLSLSRLSERERESLLTKGSNELRSRLSGFLYRLDLTCMPKIENRTLRGPRTARTAAGSPRNAKPNFIPYLFDLAFEPWPRRLAPGPPRVEQVCTDESWTRAFYQSHTHTHTLCTLLSSRQSAEGRGQSTRLQRRERQRSHAHAPWSRII